MINDLSLLEVSRSGSENAVRVQGWRRSHQPFSSRGAKIHWGW